ncbi:MAG: hypothetical protein ACKV19_29420 [Verrucomicrobiales bacterium]
MSASLLESPAAGAPAEGQSNGGTAPDSTSTPPQGGSGEDWKSELPEAFRTTPSLQPFQGFASRAEMLEALGRSYVETKAMVGKRLEAPGPDATPDQIAAWRKVVGAPDSPDGYGETLRPETFPEDQWDAESEKEFRSIAHKHHLSPSAVKDIIGYYEKSVLAGVDQAKAGEPEFLAAETATLKKAWGGEYHRNLGLAQRFAATLGLKSDNPVFTSAEVVQAMARGASLLSESKLITGQAAGLPASNQERAQAIMDSKNQDLLAREYRGEFGRERQLQAQQVLHQLLQTS